MAGYTSRFFLTLTIPSIFGFLSVLWFLKRRNLISKQVGKAIQVENTADTLKEDQHLFSPMKLKAEISRQEDEQNQNSEMQLKETQTLVEKQPHSNGTSEPKVKAKKNKSKVHENGTICCQTEPIINGYAKKISVTVEDSKELTNEIKALNLSKENSVTNGAVISVSTNEACAQTEIVNGTKSKSETNSCSCKTEIQTNSVAGETMDVPVTEKTETNKLSPQENGAVQDIDDVNVDRNCNTHNTDVAAEITTTCDVPKTDSHCPLSLPVECNGATVQEDMLESPGAKYCDSVGSNDSGKGGSEFQFVIEQPNFYMVYEFEILQELCGLLIGKNGRHVCYIKQETNANILIKKHPYFHHMKVCSVTGTEDEIHAALKLIRKRFPVEVYPTVTLSQINILPIGFQSPECLKLCLPEGVSFEAMLCATVSAGHFFLQQPTHPTFHSLLALTSQMTAVYSQLDTPLLSHVAKGYVCVANLTSGWFRAEVDEVLENTDECRLKFLDYGGYAIAPRTALRQIRFDFMNVPFQATECYLGSITFPEGESEWSCEATAAFEELAQGQIVQGCIVGYAENRVPYVHLYKITGATSIFINRELVIRGLARWVLQPQ